MAVSVDTVYQRVLAILNKENRGYVTPQEYNLFANQAQLEIFEQYFFDLNQYSRAAKNDTEYSNLPKLINEKLSKFKKSAVLTYSTDRFNLPTDLHKIGTLIYNDTNSDKSVCVLDFGSVKTIAAETLTVTLPNNTATTALIRFE